MALGAVVPPQRSRHRGLWVGAIVLASLLILAAAGSVVALTVGHVASKPAVSAATAKTTSTSTSTTASSVAQASFSALYRADNSGVVRITATSCGQSDIGTGFLIGQGLVATAEHVVDGAITIGLSDAQTTTTGQVVGSDPTNDLALIRTNLPLTGHQFGFAPSDPSVGTPVGVIGFPLGGPISFTSGTVSGLDRSLPIGSTMRSGLLQTDAPLNPGDSGGPVLLSDGEVVGLADAGTVNAQGLGYAVPASVAAPIFASWAANSPVPPAAHCSNPLGPSQTSGQTVTDNSGSADGPAIAAALQIYFSAINSGGYQIAYNQLGPAIQTATSYNTFAADDASSYDISVTLNSVTPNGNGTDYAYVTFFSLQDPGTGPHGESCDHWSLDYTMLSSGGTWLINGATGHDGPPAQSCG